MRNMRQRYGQHFLVNRRVIEEITQAALRLKAAQTVEIGPGKGALTFALRPGLRVFRRRKLTRK